MPLHIGREHAAEAVQHAASSCGTVQLLCVHMESYDCVLVFVPVCVFPCACVRVFVKVCVYICVCVCVCLCECA